MYIFVIFQWVANPANDMYADTVTTVILEVQSNPKIQKGSKFSICLFNWGFLLKFWYQAKGMSCLVIDFPLLSFISLWNFFRFLLLKNRITTWLSLFVTHLCVETFFYTSTYMYSWLWKMQPYSLFLFLYINYLNCIIPDRHWNISVSYSKVMVTIHE